MRSWGTAKATGGPHEGNGVKQEIEKKEFSVVGQILLKCSFFDISQFYEVTEWVP